MRNPVRSVLNWYQRQNIRMQITVAILGVIGLVLAATVGGCFDLLSAIVQSKAPQTSVPGSVTQQDSGNFQAGRDLSIAVKDSAVQGDVVLGDKSVNVIGSQVPTAQNQEVERRRIKTAIRRSIEDGWEEAQRLFQETNTLREQITSRHNARGTLSSGVHLADQAKRARAFNQDCEKVVQRIDRAIEDALIEQGGGAFNTADWLQEERKLYGSLTGFIAEKQNQVAQEGLELAKRLGNEALWTELMNK